MSAFLEQETLNGAVWPYAIHYPNNRTHNESENDDERKRTQEQS